MKMTFLVTIDAPQPLDQQSDGYADEIHDMLADELDVLSVLPINNQTATQPTFDEV